MNKTSIYFLLSLLSLPSLAASQKEFINRSGFDQAESLQKWALRICQANLQRRKERELEQRRLQQQRRQRSHENANLRNSNSGKRGWANITIYPPESKVEWAKARRRIKEIEKAEAFYQAQREQRQQEINRQDKGGDVS